MAEKEYTVVAPDGKEITLIGPVGASQDEIIAQAQKLYKPQAKQESFANPKEQQTLYTEDTIYDPVSGLPLSSTPTQQNLGGGYQTARNVANTVAGMPINYAMSTAKPVLGTAQLASHLLGSKLGNEPVRAMRQIEKGINQNAGDTGSYFTKGASLVGDVANPLTLSAGQKIMGLSKNIPAMPSYAQNILGGGATGAFVGLTNPENPDLSGEDYAKEKAKSVALSTALGSVIPAGGEVIKGVNKGLGLNIGLKPSVNVPTAQELSNQSTQLFNVAKQSGVQIDPNKFGLAMDNIGRSLRAEGYTPTGYPKITAALEEMKNTAMPKDFTELQALRKIIQGAQGSADATERRLGTILKSEFDSYIANIPNDAIVGGSKQGLQAWKQARDLYAKQSKAEIFEDMLARAQLDKSKFTASGTENSLAQQLRNLAKNDKQMRLFTKEEQQAIKEAAEGGNVQNMLKFVGRFAPTGPVTGIFTGGAIATNPVLGAGIAGTAAASRLAASQIRKTDVKKLADMMRAGQPFEMIPKVNLTDQQRNLARMLMLQSINQGE